ncbi:MAG: tetrathionate reductase family octaheme c-type cytochrome [Gammaproteobacteria bacterium]|nr:tetrathionate reductase family octaheme c-type cytochrome [Gammaproteobacteria bacterium]
MILLSILCYANTAFASTTDHTKLDELKGPFANGPEVTKACLACHNKAALQVNHSIHGTWEYDHPKTGQKLGKRKVINSFCGNVVSNEPRCTSCHASYGWRDMTKKPPMATDENMTDCLVCHDTTGEYTKWPTGAGHPLYKPKKKKDKTHMPPDLAKIAQNIGMPGRENCGSCHYYGGGGDNVKHGDLSSALNNPSKHVDVHMDKDGLNFTCSKCHVADEHKWAGSHYSLRATDIEGTGKPGERRNSASCESCHGLEPHPKNSVIGLKINHHTDKVACETCHIPEYAKGGVATKTYWDWSSADKSGKKGEGIEDYVQGDGKHRHGYLKHKGIFKYGEDVKPYYAWFDGQIEYTNTDRKIDPTKVVEVNMIKGSYDDPDSRIWPFKRMQGRQAYDKVNNNLVYTQVWGPKTKTAFWTNFDWQKSITTAMKKGGKPYSGEFGFVDTYMYWPTTHMVSPKEEALRCKECHAEEGRLKDVNIPYMPGTGKTKLLDLIGMLAILGTLIGVFGHAIIRRITARMRNS